MQQTEQLMSPSNIAIHKSCVLSNGDFIISYQRGSYICAQIYDNDGNIKYSETKLSGAGYQIKDICSLTASGELENGFAIGFYRWYNRKKQVIIKLFTNDMKEKAQYKIDTPGLYSNGYNKIKILNIKENFIVFSWVDTNENNICIKTFDYNLNQYESDAVGISAGLYTISGIHLTNLSNEEFLLTWEIRHRQHNSLASLECMKFEIIDNKKQAIPQGPNSDQSIFEIVPIQPGREHTGYHEFEIAYSEINNKYVISYRESAAVRSPDHAKYQSDVHVRLYDITTNQLQESIQITKQELQQCWTNIYLLDNSFIVSWTNTAGYERRDSYMSDCFFQQLDYDGKLMGEHTQIADSTHNRQELAQFNSLGNNKHVIIWKSNQQGDGINFAFSVYGKIITIEDSSKHDENLIKNSQNIEPIIPDAVLIAEFFTYVNNLILDIELINTTTVDINNLISRGLHLSECLAPIAEQKTLWEEKVNVLFNGIKSELQTLKIADDRIISEIDVNEIILDIENKSESEKQNTLKNTYESLYTNLVEDINILTNARNDILRYKSLGVDLGDALQKIDEQINSLVNVLNTSKQSLTELVNKAKEDSELIH